MLSDIALIPAIIFLILFMTYTYIRIVTLLKGAPNVPTKDAVVSAMIDLAQLKKIDKIADLGSGDGKILIALAKKGFACTGIEINPVIIRKSRKIIKEHRADRFASVQFGTFWKADLSDYTVIFIYQVPSVLKDLEVKLQKELKPGSRVISNRYPFPHWKISEKKNDAYLYIL